MTSIPLPDLQAIRFGRMLRLTRLTRLVRIVRILRILRAVAFFWRGAKQIEHWKDTKDMETDLEAGELQLPRVFNLRLVKGTILSLFIVEIFTPFIESETLNQDNRQKPSFYGSFYIEQNEENSIIPGNTSRIHFHKDGYLITENNQQEFEDYKIDMSIGNNSFSIKATNHLFRFYEEKNTVQLKVIKNKDTCNLNLRRIKNQNLPISNDGFHLTAEQIINEQHEQNHE